jgi:hypothetical protein
MVWGGHETAHGLVVWVVVGCGDGAGRAQDRAPTGWWYGLSWAAEMVRGGHETAPLRVGGV